MGKKGMNKNINLQTYKLQPTLSSVKYEFARKNTRLCGLIWMAGMEEAEKGRERKNKK